MAENRRDQIVNRRTALRTMLASAGAASLAPVIGQAYYDSPGPGILVETLPSGVEIWQITNEEFSHSNIYCEVPYCSADSRFFVYQRSNPRLSTDRTEFMVVELGTGKQHRLDTSCGLNGSAITHDGMLYYCKTADDGSVDLMKANLTSGAVDRVYRVQDNVRVRSLGTVSANKRYYAGGTKVEPGWDSFDILLIDVEQGTQTILDRDPYILNPHPQFDHRDTNQLMIQHNRGGKYSGDGKLERLVGPEGATLYLLSVPDGKRTLLQVGTPHTTACTGHEAWIGTTGEMLLSVSAHGDFAQDKGNLLGVRAGRPARVVAKGFRFNHVGVSRCGRFFSADDWQDTYKIVIGSISTGKTAVVCESKTSPKRSQNTHPHPYLTPDLKWVIFNSNRSGFSHIYAARLPDGMTNELC